MSGYFNFNKTVKTIFCSLYKKYQTSSKMINSYIIDNLIFNEKTHIVSVFKDFLIYDDNYDFFRKFYNIHESNRKLKKYLRYYEEYNITLPNYSSLPESNYIYHNIRLKQILINKIQANKTKQRLKKERENDSSQFFDRESFEKIFNSHVYNSILKKSEKCLSIFGIDNENQNGKNEKSITISQIGDIIKNINEVDLKIAEKKNNDNNKKIYSKKKKILPSKKTNSKDSLLFINKNNIINGNNIIFNNKNKQITKDVLSVRRRMVNFKSNIRLNYLNKLEKFYEKNNGVFKQNYSVTNSENKSKKILLNSTINNNTSNNNSTMISNTNNTFIQIKKFNFNSFLFNKSNSKTIHTSLHKSHLKSKILSDDFQKIKVNTKSNKKLQNKYSTLLKKNNFLWKTINENSNENIKGLYIPKKNYKFIKNMKKQSILAHSPNINSLAIIKNKNRIVRIGSSKKDFKNNIYKFPRLKHFNTIEIRKKIVTNSFLLPKKEYLLNGNKLELKNKSINTDLLTNINDSNYRLITLNNSKKRINTEISRLINSPFGKINANSKKILLDDNTHILNSNKFATIDSINFSNKKEFFKKYLKKRSINNSKNINNNINYTTSSYIRNTTSNQSINGGNISMKNNNKFHVKTRNENLFSNNNSGNNFQKMSKKLNYTTIGHKYNKINKIDYKNDNKKERLKIVKNYQDKQISKIIEKENLIREKFKKNIKFIYNNIEKKEIKFISGFNGDRVGKK